jgi:hypothetical protein
VIKILRAAGAAFAKGNEEPYCLHVKLTQATPGASGITVRLRSQAFFGSIDPVADIGRPFPRGAVKLVEALHVAVVQR